MGLGVGAIVAVLGSSNHWRCLGRRHLLPAVCRGFTEDSSRRGEVFTTRLIDAILRHHPGNCRLRFYREKTDSCSSGLWPWPVYSYCFRPDCRAKGSDISQLRRDNQRHAKAMRERNHSSCRANG
jgi:hypothetical protein